MKHLQLIPFLVLLFVVSISCDNDDDNPTVINETEVITNMVITLSGNGSPVLLSSVDPDGPDGPTAPVLTVSGPLAANSTYQGSVVLTDASDPNDIENITEEVEEEDLEHQFFYEVSSNLNASFTYGNFDSENNPLGTEFTLTTGGASNGTITFALVHEGNKNAEGVSDGDRTNAGGDIDIEQTFTVTIQ